MTYPETARRFALAEQSTRSGAAPDVATLGAAKLPMSDWAEARRDIMGPQTIAANHALHVQGAAFDLRKAAAEWEAIASTPTTPEQRHVAAQRMDTAARALLAAIGEGEA
ncbi:hypothetical protein [Microbacterium sp. No. 7]|uniref:hypothetical protein n=1 Tax=Microbacterium sp. No. 7 TaxID=1714373 RepID=UPI0006D0C90B|nr:hypothetical protein [Microbacterium sp. No. 7]ALJ22057.1 hypothetical protein AOA12_20045 [Microbacterium sp. No. 7]